MPKPCSRASKAANIVVLSTEDLVARVKEITRGEGVAVVYDSVGKDTFMSSLDCLRPLGMMVSFGNASGPPPAFSPLELAKRGSLFLTRPTLFHYIAKRDALESAARELFAAVKSKAVRIKIGQTYALGRCGAGASRSGGAPNDGIDGAVALRIRRPRGRSAR